jgi:YHS domain-containing protein
LRDELRLGELAAGRHQVLITADMWKRARELANTEFIRLGKRKLKGLAREVVVFEARMAGKTPSNRETDPVCGMELGPTEVAARLTWDGRGRAFCSDDCLKKFVRDPDKYNLSACSLGSTQWLRSTASPDAKELAVGLQPADARRWLSCPAAMPQHSELAPNLRTTAADHETRHHRRNAGRRTRIRRPHPAAHGNAGLAVAQEAWLLLGELAERRILVLCGPGNNGATASSPPVTSGLGR